MSKGAFTGIRAKVLIGVAAIALACCAAVALAAAVAAWQAGAEGQVLLPRVALWSAVAGTVALALVLAAGHLFARRALVRPLGQATLLVRGLSRGEFGQRLDMRRRDEIGALAEVIDELAHNLEHEVVAAFERLSAGDLTFHARGVIRDGLDKTNVRLTELLYELRQAGEQIALGSSQIANANQAQSQGATEQASAIEEISTAIAELASQTKLNAQHAEEASLLARSARDEAQRGNGQMQEMVQSMREINAGSREISKIIKVIDDIAFQTNLLSLNAAVEAGRAGKHGRGFAVVADEVRKLAAKSAQAARETAELIELSVQKAQTGAQIAESTAASFDGITQGINKVADLVGEIAAASREQAQGIAQISVGLSEIDKVTQANSANTEESAAAAAELASQAAQMKTMLSQFRLRHEAAQPSAGGDGHGAEAAPEAEPPERAARDWAESPVAVEPRRRAPAPLALGLNHAEFGKY
jgi:methyl-accepting chemotaxis protein